MPTIQNDSGHKRAALLLIGMLLFVPVVITCVLASEVLGLFGAGYADYSTLLVLLLLGTFPDALNQRGCGDSARTAPTSGVAALTVAAAAITIGGAWLLCRIWESSAQRAPLASQVIVATALAVGWCRRSVVGSRIAAGG